MKTVKELSLGLLSELAILPSVPFYESLIQAKICKILNQYSISYFFDSFGNIIAEIGEESDHLDPIAFVAHMDHPGFEIERNLDGKLIAFPKGGIPQFSLNHETKMFSFNELGERIRCTISPNSENPKTVIVNSENLIEIGSPLTFDLIDFQIKGDKISMRSADDFAGCAAILTNLIENLGKVERKIFGVFTRAEEVGLIGARLIARDEIIPKNSIVVSVETSSVIPVIKQGDGPVIRTGDATYTFNSFAENLLRVAANQLKERDESFMFQRSLMSAGTCEASAFAANGYLTTGIAFPLGHWHNAKTSIPDINGGIDAENISLNDFLNGVLLMIECSKLSICQSKDPIAQKLKHVPEDFESRLTS